MEPNDGLPERAELRELYKLTIDEYRFEVNLNWDRLKHYFLLNAGLTSVAATLFGGMLTTDGISLGRGLVVGALFLIGFATAVMGVVSTIQSREYYRTTVFKKALLEQLLGYDRQVPGQESDLATLAVTTTRGMKRAQEILAWREQDIRAPQLRLGNLTSYSLVVLGLFGVGDLVCCGYIGARVLLHCLGP